MCGTYLSRLKKTPPLLSVRYGDLELLQLVVVGEVVGVDSTVVAVRGHQEY